MTGLHEVANSGANICEDRPNKPHAQLTTNTTGRENNRHTIASPILLIKPARMRLGMPNLIKSGRKYQKTQK
jgi:hypothetical protein